MDILNEVRERLSIFQNLYDAIRIVNPITKEVIASETFRMEKMICDKTCHKLWKKEKACKNCVAIKAVMENNTFIKLEYTCGRTYFIIASPLKINESTYVVELLKDISEKSNMFINEEMGKNQFKNVLSEINDKIIKDDLTGVYNKRYINERLPIDIDESIANKRPMSIVMADIDLFKNINDSYGHVIGDKVIRDFARVIEGSIRKNTDWVGRYGGEEFLIVLNGIDLDGAYKVSEKIRKLIQSTIFQYDEKQIKITSSFGVYGLITNKINMEKMIEAVDKNLYTAKINGRNKTIISNIS